jgi:hypothetical protein
MGGIFTRVRCFVFMLNTHFEKENIDNIVEGRENEYSKIT